MTSLLILTDWKKNSYDTIFVIVDCFTKIVHHEPVKTIIYATGWAKIIIDLVVRQYGLQESIIGDRDSLFTIKLRFLLYFFLTLNESSLLHFICRLRSKLRGRIEQWKLIFIYLSIGNRIIKLDSCPWSSSLITMPEIWAPATHFLSSTTNIISVFLSNMKLILT